MHDVVCRVGEHQHRLAHQCSLCYQFFCTHIKCEVNHNGNMGMGHLCLKWVGDQYFWNTYKELKNFQLQNISWKTMSSTKHIAGMVCRNKADGKGFS